VGVLLNAAVVLLALLVCASLALLAWTLAINGRDAVRTERARVAAARASLATTEATMRERLAIAGATLRDVFDRMRPKGDS
jgi:hypothetical protein